MTCFRHYDILGQARSRMTTAITFSRQNDSGSRARTTSYWKNLILVVILVTRDQTALLKGVSIKYVCMSQNLKVSN